MLGTYKTIPSLKATIDNGHCTNFEAEAHINR